jgi:hypothetical protein
LEPKPMTETINKVEYMSVIRMVSQASHNSDPNPVMITYYQAGI